MIIKTISKTVAYRLNACDHYAGWFTDPIQHIVNWNISFFKNTLCTMYLICILCNKIRATFIYSFFQKSRFKLLWTEKKSEFWNEWLEIFTLNFNLNAVLRFVAFILYCFDFCVVSFYFSPFKFSTRIFNNVFAVDCLV